MKPGNLLIQGAKSVGKTRDEDSIERTSGPTCDVRFFVLSLRNPIRFLKPSLLTERIELWKKDYLLPNV